MELIHRNLLIGIHDALQETFFRKKINMPTRLLRDFSKHTENGEARTELLFLRFSIILSVGKKRLEYYMGEGAKPGNIYRMILAYLLWTKNSLQKSLKNLKVLKIADILNKLKKGTVPTKSCTIFNSGMAC